MTIAELIKELQKYPQHYWLKADVGPIVTGVHASRDKINQPELVILSTSDVF